MRERMGFNEAGNRFERRPRASPDDHIRPAQVTNSAVGKSDLQGLWADESPGSHDEFSSTLIEVIDVDVDQVLHHLPLAVAHDSHIDPEAIFGNAELFASAEVGSDLRAMDDVLAWQTCDVRARAADVPALDDSDALTLFRKGPRDVFRSLAAAENDKIVLFGNGTAVRLRTVRKFDDIHENHRVSINSTQQELGNKEYISLSEEAVANVSALRIIHWGEFIGRRAQG